jgi:hypothetical protein
VIYRGTVRRLLEGRWHGHDAVDDRAGKSVVLAHKIRYKFPPPHDDFLILFSRSRNRATLSCRNTA